MAYGSSSSATTATTSSSLTNRCAALAESLKKTQNSTVIPCSATPAASLSGRVGLPLPVWDAAGFGFVTFERAEDARRAIQRLNGRRTNAGVLKLSEAKSRGYENAVRRRDASKKLRAGGGPKDPGTNPYGRS